MKIVEQNGATEQHLWVTGKAYSLSRQSTKHAARGYAVSSMGLIGQTELLSNCPKSATRSKRSVQ